MGATPGLSQSISWFHLSSTTPPYSRCSAPLYSWPFGPRPLLGSVAHRYWPLEGDSQRVLGAMADIQKEGSLNRGSGDPMVKKWLWRWVCYKEWEFARQARVRSCVGTEMVTTGGLTEGARQTQGARRGGRCQSISTTGLEAMRIIKGFKLGGSLS